VLEVLLALLAALAFATGTVCMQKGTLQMPPGESEKPGFLLKLLRKPIWVIGIFIDLLGFVAQAGALAVGRIVVVQPLLVTTVVFALPLGVKFTGQRVGRWEIVGAGLVVGGIAVFVVLNNPDEGATDSTWARWLIAAGALLAIAVALVILCRGRRPGLMAAMLGTAAGCVFGLTAGLIKAFVTRFDSGFGAVFADWHIYVFVVLEILAFSLLQRALATGSLAPAIAANMSVETVVSILLGVLLFKEDLHPTPALLAVSILALLAAFVGIVLLARSEGASHGSTPAPPPTTPLPEPAT
jgi:drug/metabolite transporter (DMT)-like permease